jgi:hypothetical protein
MPTMERNRTVEITHALELNPGKTSNTICPVKMIARQRDLSVHSTPTVVSVISLRRLVRMFPSHR